MRRFTSAVIIVMASSFALMPTPVHADCAADIEAIEQEMGSSSGGTKVEAGQLKAARNLVNKAKAALAEGKIKRCDKLVQEAHKKLSGG